VFGPASALASRIAVEDTKATRTLELDTNFPTLLTLRGDLLHHGCYINAAAIGACRSLFIGHTSQSNLLRNQGAFVDAQLRAHESHSRQ
jgi:hypothetical protein